jgi:hypothetical protein
MPVLAAAFWCVEFGYGRRTNGERAAGCLGNGTSRYSAGVASSRRMLSQSCFTATQRAHSPTHYQPFGQYQSAPRNATNPYIIHGVKKQPF